MFFITPACITLKCLVGLSVVLTCVFWGNSIRAQPVGSQTPIHQNATVSEQPLQVDRISIAGGSNASSSNVLSSNALNSRALKRLREQALQELQRREASLTLDQLHQIADTLTLTLRRKGFRFDTVYLPPQTVKRGNVQFIYQPAHLEKVHVINQTPFPSRTLQQAFSSVLGRRLYVPDVEDIVYLLQAKAGLQLYAFFSRGSAPGQITLNLKATKKAVSPLALQLDNFGSDAAGEHRLQADIRLHSLLRSFDGLSLSVLSSVGDQGSSFGAIRYQVPFPNQRTQFFMSVGDSRYQQEASATALEFSGNARSLRIGIEHRGSSRPQHQWQWRLAAQEKRSRFESEFGEGLSQQERSRGLSLGVEQSLASAQQKLQFSWGLDGFQGRATTGSTATEVDLQKWEYFARLDTRIPLGSRWYFSPFMTLRGQHTKDKLVPSIEKIVLSGAYGVRASPAGRFSANSGYVASLHAQVTWRGDTWQFSPFVFTDLGEGESDNAGQRLTTSLRGDGVGLKVLSTHWSMEILGAQARRQSLSTGDTSAEVEHDQQIWFHLRWHW